MKRVNIFLLLCLVSIVVLAQKPYTIYDWSGQVRIKEYKGQQWLPVEKGKPVSGVDSVDIAKKGTLRIIDNRSNLIYKSLNTGKMRVLAIINEAKNQHSRTLAAVNQELLNGAKGASSAPTMQVAGATTRSDDIDKRMDSIVSTFGWIANKAYKNELTNNSSYLILKSHTTKDGVYFEMQNSSDNGYYVNVLRLNKQTRKINLCYIIEQSQISDAPYIFLPKNKAIQIAEIVFCANPSDDIFILVGTEDPFIPEEMQNALQYVEIESAQPLYNKFKYFKL